ncbi:MAG TPA: carboxylesterase [Pseudohongiella sp.]|nr:carboxylesterase [Pseudohongiella sp.]HBX38853.1 carboxylesterase [Pseudohongiella sp.]|tara:strand:- start:6024 stop:7613 length:1590 start_codon:yes stop_codon:yes gene_type:complete
MRKTLKTLLVAAVGLWAGAIVAQQPTQTALVRLDTPQGALLGTASERHPQVSIFKGIPYAMPPVGQDRWQAPKPAPSWQGERLADSFGPDCLQQPYPEGSFFYRPARVSSEDCLYLNVWSAAEPGADRPVMVWIHGGALTRGSGAIDTYDGTSLAAKDVVVVTINYRLGVFGFFAHPELVSESPEFSAGNYGILDQIEALRWVQQNISAFGGDPDNVTIFGESAGAWSVNLLTASPLTEGLFHKVIAQSGARLDTRVALDRQTSAGPSAINSGVELATQLGANSLADLRNMPGRQLMDAAMAAGFRTDGIVDGWVIPAQPYEIFSEGRQRAVPVMVGFNSDEGTTLGAAANLPSTAEAYRARLQAQYGDFADLVLDVYPEENIRESVLASFRDATFGWNMVTWANLTRHVGQSAYLYYFTHQPPGAAEANLGAYHASEIAYAFNNIQTLRSRGTAFDYRLADIMSDYWVNFAHHGQPSAPGQAEWLPYSNAERNYLLIGTEVSAETDLMPDNWAVFDRVMDRRRQPVSD